MTPEEIEEMRALAGFHAIKVAAPHEDLTGLVSALVRRYLEHFEDSLDDYAASWDATREDPEGRVWPAWSELDLRTRARYVGLEIAQCAIAMVDRIENAEAGIHDCMPEAWEVQDV